MKALKKASFTLLAFLMVCSMVLTGIPVTALASSSTSGDYTFIVNEGGSSVTITGYTGSETNVLIPDTLDGKSVTAIGNEAFYLDSDIEQVVIPDSVKSIGEKAFASCWSLTSVSLGKGIATIGKNAFASCSSLQEYVVHSENSYLSAVGGVLFNKARTTLLLYPQGLPGDYTISDSVTALGEGAFESCSLLTSLSIGAGLSTELDGQDFGGCVSLMEFVVNSGNTSYCSVNGVLFNKEKKKILAYPAGNAASSYSIPEGVTTIGNGAFLASQKLTSITIPTSVSSIGQYAFALTGLINTAIPEGIKTIEEGTFFLCMNLTSITIPDSVTTISKQAFTMCGISSFTVSSAVTKIEPQAFTMCDGLASFTVAEGNGYFSAENGILFNKTGTQLLVYPIARAGDSYTVPDSVTAIGQGAFGYTNLTSVILPASLTTIDTGTFEGSSITSITIPDSVTGIADNAFASSSLKAALIGKGVTSLGKSAFAGCYELRDVYFFGNAPSMDKDEKAFDGSSDSLILFYVKGTTGFSSPWNGYRTAQFDHDKTCTVAFNLSEVPAKAIDPQKVYSGARAVQPDDPEYSKYDFGGWYKESTCINAWNFDTQFVTSDTMLFAKWISNKSSGYFLYSESDGKITITGYTSVGGAVVIPGAIGGKPVVAIGEYAFHGSSITSVSIPSSVKTIGADAFSNCSRLASVKLNGGITDIKDWAFSYCDKLTTITIPKSVKSIGTGVFAGDEALTSIQVDTANTTYCSVNGVLFNKNKTELLQYPCGKTGSYTIPDGVVTIAESAFSDSTYILSVTIPKTVSSIGEYAFYNCPKLQSIVVDGDNKSYASLYGVLCDKGMTELIQCPAAKEGSFVIPDTILVIGDAFAFCTKLTSITIGSGVKDVGEDPFYYCKSLTQIQVDADNTSYSSVGGVLFSKDKTLLVRYPEGKVGDYTVPDGVKTIGEIAFFNSDKIEDVVLSDSVTDIVPGAFYQSSLSGITLGSGITEIEYYTFYGCANLTQINTVNGSAQYASIGGVLFSKDKTKLILFPFGYKGSYTVPDGVASIEEGAFYRCTGLTKVTVSDSIKSIGMGAFEGCEGLKSAEFGGGMTEIGSFAFYGSGLSAAYFFGNAPALGNYVFNACASDFTTFYIKGKTGFESWEEYATAVFDPNKTCTVSFDINGADGSAMTSQQVYYGGKAVEPKNPTNTGYKFDGWYKEADGLNAWDFASFVTSNTTLYARWTAGATYAVKAKPNRSSYGTVTGAGKYLDGKTVTLTAVPKNGYRFVRWLENSTVVSTEPVYTFQVTKSTTLTAEFAAIGIPKLTIEYSGYNRLKLTWTEVTGAEGYSIYRLTPGSKSYEKVTDTTGLTYQDTGLTTGSKYSYRVCAYCVSDNGTTYGRYATKTAVPKWPTIMLAVVLSDYHDASLSWNTVADAQGYELWRSTSKKSGYEKVEDVADTQYLDEGLDVGKTYYYKVRPYTDAGGSRNRGAFSAYKAVTPKWPAIKLTSAVLQGTHSAVLNWKAIAGVDGYTVFRSMKAKGPYSEIATDITVTTYTDDTLSAGYTYYYKVEPYDMVNGEKVYGNPSNYKAVKPRWPAVTLSVSSLGYNSLQLTWNSISGATGYEIQRWNPETISFETIGQAFVGTYTDKGLEAGSSYKYRVRPYVTIGSTTVHGAFSKAKSAKVVPASPIGLILGNESATSIRIAWQEVEGASMYLLYRSTSATGKYTLITRTTSTNYIDEGLTTGITYYYKVRAYTQSTTNGTVFSAFSAASNLKAQ